MFSLFCVDTDCLNSFSQPLYSNFMNEDSEPEEAEQLVQGRSFGRKMAAWGLKTRSA